MIASAFFVEQAFEATELQKSLKGTSKNKRFPVLLRR